MGTEPVDEEIPIEFEDLPPEVQFSLSIYNRLKDDWDAMNGNYLGKSYVGMIDVFDLMEVPKEERLHVLNLINIIDEKRGVVIRRRLKEASQKKPN